MSICSVNINLRPIKLAFLVSPSDRQSLLESIRINSFLWGGVYNPIIPYYHRSPKDEHYKLSGKDITDGYIKAFDPDFIVPMGNIKGYTTSFPKEKIVNPDEIMSHIKDDWAPCYGIGLFELLNALYEKEFKFIRKQPLQCTFPVINSQFNLFLSSIFGALSEDINDIVKNNFDKPLDINRPQVTIYDYFKMLEPNILFPGRITEMWIAPFRFNSYGDDRRYIFLMNANSLVDIIDYWNLRAFGWFVIPIAHQICDTDSAKSISSKFIESNYVPYRNNPNLFHSTTILKSKNITTDELNNFTSSLGIKNNNDYNCKFSVQAWYPPIWEQSSRKYNSCKLEVKKEIIDIQAIPSRITLKTVDPDFEIYLGGYGICKYANELDVRLYGDEGELYAEVIPDEPENIAYSIGALGHREWRISKEGIVYLARHTKWQMSFGVPLAENVMTAWMKSKKWMVTVSSAGLIAKQMLKQLGGSFGIGVLATPGLIQLLNGMSKGKAINHKEFRAKIQQITNNKQFPPEPKWFLKRLIESKIFRLGVIIQCQSCQQHSWYTLTDFDYKIKCPTCLNENDIPSYSPNDIVWSYRSFGAFSLRDQAYGVYTVLLTYYFFTRTIDNATTPLLSFKAKKNNIEIEIDLALFLQESRFNNPRRELIFVECKTFNRFEKKDIDRMVQITREFPEAIIVFSTLNPTLTKKEKNLLLSLVKKSRSPRNGKLVNSPVLILTSTELFSDSYLSLTYKEKGGDYAKFERSDLSQIRSLCDITQQLYLNIDPYSKYRIKH